MTSQLPATWLFVQDLVRVNNKQTSKRCIAGPFVRWIHQWLVVSHHKGPVMRKCFPWCDVINNSDLHWLVAIISYWRAVILISVDLYGGISLWATIFTLYAPNCFRDAYKYIGIFCRFLTFGWCSWLKIFPLDDKDLCIQHSWYFGCWRHCYMHYLESKVIYLDSNFTDIDDKWALVQVLSWHGLNDLMPEPMMVQWIVSLRFKTS